MTRRYRCTALLTGLLALAAGSSPASTGETVLASRPDVGEARANGSSYHTTISGNGRFVTFMSSASNLVPGDTNGAYDVFVRDIAQGRTVLASRARGSAGAISNGRSSWPAISGNGETVAFQSFASNLVARDRNHHADVFVRDLGRGTTTVVSRALGAGLGNGNSLDPSVSAGGRYVAFQSFAGNLVPGDLNGKPDVFVRDLGRGVTVTASRPDGGRGASANGSSDNPSLSGDGRVVAFESTASNLAGRDRNGRSDVFVRDLRTGRTRLVSRTRSGAAANGASYMPSLSANGRFVAFASRASNLVAGDRNGAEDVFVLDLGTGRMRLVSSHERGGRAARTIYPSISGDGHVVVFHSDAPDIVAGDVNGDGDVFARDLVHGITTVVSHPSGGSPPTANGYSGGPSISVDGRFAAFASFASDLVPGRGGRLAEIFRAALH